jgi:hypothetical protein
MAVKDCVTPSYYGIPVKEELPYLGITISKDQKSRGLLNFNPLVKKNDEEAKSIATEGLVFKRKSPNNQG